MGVVRDGRDLIGCCSVGVAFLCGRGLRRAGPPAVSLWAWSFVGGVVCEGVVSVGVVCGERGQHGLPRAWPVVGVSRCGRDPAVGGAGVASEQGGQSLRAAPAAPPSPCFNGSTCPPRPLAGSHGVTCARPPHAPPGSVSLRARGRAMRSAWSVRAAWAGRGGASGNESRRGAAQHGAEGSA